MDRIINQYKGKTPDEVWFKWGKEQRYHFLFDHMEEFGVSKGSEDQLEELIDYHYSNLPESIKQSLTGHMLMGQYKKGGMYSEGGGIDFDKIGKFLNQEVSFKDLFTK